MRNKKRRAPNAFKHGAFSRDVLIPGEDEEEFQALISDLVQEWMPLGPTEEDAVLSLAEAIWRTRRVQRFLGIRLTKNFCNPSHPSYDEYTALSSFTVLLRVHPDLAIENARRALKPEIRTSLWEKFPRHEFASTLEWAQAVASEIEAVLLPGLEPPRDPTAARLVRLLLSEPTFTDEFVNQQLRLLELLELLERLETMKDRAVKRLIQIKLMKQMIGQSGTEESEKAVKLSRPR